MRNFNVTVDGKIYQVQVEETGASAANNQAVAPVVSAPAAPVAAPVAGGGTQLKSPMPGMLVGFKVENGATVKEGQVVAIIEAMKMEQEISAPASGVITLVAQKGATMETGAVIAVIK